MIRATMALPLVAEKLHVKSRHKQRVNQVGFRWSVFEVSCPIGRFFSKCRAISPDTLQKNAALAAPEPRAESSARRHDQGAP